MKNVNINGSAKHSDKQSIFNTNSSLSLGFGDYIQLGQKITDEIILENGDFTQQLNFWTILDTLGGKDAAITDNNTVVLYTNVDPARDSRISQEINVIKGQSYTITVGIVNERGGKTGLFLNNNLVQEVSGGSGETEYAVTYTFTAKQKRML